MEKTVMIIIATITISGVFVQGVSEFLDYQKELRIKELNLEETKIAIQSGLQQCVDNDKIVWKKECMPFE